ncbi:uncharacterized protein LOC106866855 [Brachypodium distachyon]|uniref:Uncharacterized protein n=1 Tax=Brachypodium distachyon TaxID=15368 RepID=A0A2K2CTQ0_BRADI|nr:uncharacterized protein LOC106866855 [Brachypodium distachyon]XP_014758551.1 uncharacterized protein LOC106866855 [Brachypodium distachyon]PNT65396.1 hypothetical protein BRADI_4g41685v3 [Brachypodium distachyon]|eukprot:XP_014758550.1 uncharacterized protein LOC106866855 [Brachypodium distachyon]
MLREGCALRERCRIAGGGLVDCTPSGSGGGAEERQVLGVVVGKGCLKRLAGDGSGGGSGPSKKVSFVLEPHVRVISPRAVVRARGRPEGGKRVRAGGGTAVVAGDDAPVRRSRRNVVNLGAGVELEQVTVAVSNSAEAEEDGVAEAFDRKRKRESGESSEHMAVGPRMGAPCRITRSSGLLLAAPFVWSPVIEKKRRRKNMEDETEQTCVEEEQPAEVQCLGTAVNSELVTAQEDEPAAQKVARVEDALVPIFVENKTGRKIEDAHSDGKALEMPKNDDPVPIALRDKAVQGNNIVVEESHFGKEVQNRSQPSRPDTRSNRHQQLAFSVEKEYQEHVAAPHKGHPLRQSRRNLSEANGLLNNNRTSERNNCSRVSEESNGLKIAHSCMHNTAKEDDQYGRAKGCAGAEKQMVGVVARKGCLKPLGGGASSRNSNAAKNVTFVLVEQAEADGMQFGGRPLVMWSPIAARTRCRRKTRMILPGAEASRGEHQLTHVQVGGHSVTEGDAREIASDAPLRWSRRNAVECGVGDVVQKVTGAVSRSNATRADKEEGDVGQAFDRKQKTSENAGDLVISAQVGFSRILSPASFLYSLFLRRT